MPTEPPRFLPDFRDVAGAFARTADWLGRGAQSPAHPFHWPALATTGADGRPEARIVVLRRFDATGRTAEVHTDARAPKVGQLERDPRACLLFYDGEARFQVKLSATVTVHRRDAEARTAWDALSPGTRATYATPLTPGTVVPPDADTAYPPADDAAFANFAVLACRFDELEVLELHPTGNRRGRLRWVGEWQMERLAP